MSDEPKSSIYYYIMKALYDGKGGKIYEGYNRS